MSVDAQFKQLIDRILRCREAEDAAKDDTKEVYAELKGLGYDKTIAGALVNELRKREKNPDQFAERETVLDLYRNAYQRASGTKRAIAHTHENYPSSAPTPSPVQADDSPALSPSASGSQFTRSATLAGSGGNPSIPSPEADGAKMGHHPDRAAQAVVTSVNSGQAVTHSAMTDRTKADVMRLLRPHCQHPDDTNLCGGQGTKHCNACIKAAAESVEA